MSAHYFARAEGALLSRAPDGPGRKPFSWSRTGSTRQAHVRNSSIVHSTMGTNMVRLTLGLTLTAALLASCKTNPDPRTPIDRSAENLATYIDAKKAYVAALEREIAGRDVSMSKYRLVSVVGPGWSIGTVVDPRNPLNNLTDKCVLREAAWPREIEWSSLPAFSTTRTITLGAGLPTSITSVLSKEAAVGANLTAGKTGQFGFEELKSRIPAEDDFTGSFSAECRAILGLRGGLVIRGIVTGKETLKSGASLKGGADLKVKDTELFNFKYDSTGAFDLEDKAANPKMFLVTEFKPATMGSGDVQTAPTMDTVARIEAIDLNRPPS